MRQPHTAYFDQRAWIDLANQSGTDSLLEKFVAKAEEGVVIVPLSHGNIVETVRTPNQKRRARIAEIMISLSRGTTIVPQWALVSPELKRAISRLFDLPTPASPVAFGKGVDLAFGGPRLEQLRIRFGSDAVDALSAFLSTEEGMSALLTGPFDTVYQAMSQDFLDGAAQHTALAEAARASIKTRSPIFRKRMYAAALASTLDDEIRSVASELGFSYDQLLALGQKGLMRLFSDVPCLHVEIELGSLRHSFWDRALQPNDMVDLATLASAIPYCDAVLTERFWADLARRAKLDIQYSTLISADLEEIYDSIA